MDSPTDRLSQQALATERSNCFSGLHDGSSSEPYGGCDCKACLGEVRTGPDRPFELMRLTKAEREAYISRVSGSNADELLRGFEDAVQECYTERHVKKKPASKKHYAVWDATTGIFNLARSRHQNTPEAVVAGREQVVTLRATGSSQDVDKTAASSAAAPSTTQPPSHADRAACEGEEVGQHQGEDCKDAKDGEIEDQGSEDEVWEDENAVYTHDEEAATRGSLYLRNFAQLRTMPSDKAASSNDFPRQPPPWSPNSPLLAPGHRSWSCPETTRAEEAISPMWRRAMCSHKHIQQAGKSVHEHEQEAGQNAMCHPASGKDDEERDTREREAMRAVEDTIEKNGEVEVLWASEEDGEIVLGRQQGGEEVDSVRTKDVQQIGDAHRAGASGLGTERAEEPTVGVEQRQMKENVASSGVDDGDWELL